MAQDTEVPMRLTEDEIVASLPPWYTQVSPAQLVDIPQPLQLRAARRCPVEGANHRRTLGLRHLQLRLGSAWS